VFPPDKLVDSVCWLQFHNQNVQQLGKQRIKNILLHIYRRKNQFMQHKSFSCMNETDVCIRTHSLCCVHLLYL
jgi:hypothetical protein